MLCICIVYASDVGSGLQQLHGSRNCRRGQEPGCGSRGSARTNGMEVTGTAWHGQHRGILLQPPRPVPWKHFMRLPGTIPVIPCSNIKLRWNDEEKKTSVSDASMPHLCNNGRKPSLARPERTLLFAGAFSTPLNHARRMSKRALQKCMQHSDDKWWALLDSTVRSQTAKQQRMSRMSCECESQRKPAKPSHDRRLVQEDAGALGSPGHAASSGLCLWCHCLSHSNVGCNGERCPGRLP